MGEGAACPVCEFQLLGDRFSGYRCVKCHAHYSGKYISRLQQNHLRQLINKHFDGSNAPATRVERTNIIIEDKDERVAKALDEARQAVRKAMAHIDALQRTRKNHEHQEQKVQDQYIPQRRSIIVVPKLSRKQARRR
jgi:hypothetical protein